MRRGIAILGATGSIGRSTLDVVARHPGRYRVVALTANRDVAGICAQALAFEPELVALRDAEAAAQVAARLRTELPRTQVVAGEQGLLDAATADGAGIVVAAIVGAAGLLPTLAAARAGRTILLANKEALVMAGDLFLRSVAQGGATVLPLDSEHNAVFQCLPADFDGDLDARGVRRILLTASGGPFRNLAARDFPEVTPEQACSHPNWSMGRKISVDSATLMNKGLEVIEAHWLFSAAPERIEVVVHPQSIVHSLVEYCDGSVLAQLGNPDMRTPIANCLAWPERIESGVPLLDIAHAGRLEFEPPDLARFPCLGYAFDAIRSGGATAAVLNAANEIAVAAFLERRLRFDQIPAVIAETMNRCPASRPANELPELMEVDAAARREAERICRDRVC
jgi:1-deoxy-D-xylulose-5-phosphate reductoisomerase